MRARSALQVAALAFCGSVAAQPWLMVPLDSPEQIAMSGPVMAAAARSEPTPAEVEARAFRGPRLEGGALQRAIRKVTKALDWHDDFDEALAAGREQGRPVVWIQALGDLQGFT
jgi:hypothetical protein